MLVDFTLGIFLDGPSDFIPASPTNYMYPNYCAPEQCSNQQFSLNADVWALGLDISKIASPSRYNCITS